MVKQIMRRCQCQELTIFYFQQWEDTSPPLAKGGFADYYQGLELCALCFVSLYYLLNNVSSIIKSSLVLGRTLLISANYTARGLASSN